METQWGVKCLLLFPSNKHTDMKILRTHTTEQEFVFFDLHDLDVLYFVCRGSTCYLHSQCMSTTFHFKGCHVIEN